MGMGRSTPSDYSSRECGLGFDVIGNLECLSWGVWSDLRAVVLTDCKHIDLKLGDIARHLKDGEELARRTEP